MSSRLTRTGRWSTATARRHERVEFDLSPVWLIGASNPARPGREAPGAGRCVTGSAPSRRRRAGRRVEGGYCRRSGGTSRSRRGLRHRDRLGMAWHQLRSVPERSRWHNTYGPFHARGPRQRRDRLRAGPRRPGEQVTSDPLRGRQIGSQGVVCFGSLRRQLPRHAHSLRLVDLGESSPPAVVQRVQLGQARLVEVLT